jgi:hypothetical protein
MSSQSIYIVDTPIEELSNDDINFIANQLQTHITLCIKTLQNRGEKLQNLIQQLITQNLCDICLIDRSMSPILIGELFNKIQNIQTTIQVHFLRTNKVI